MARTQSKEAHEKVLKAVLELIAERGIEGTSMDAISTASGVSKATVYKHWGNKDALVVDAIRNQAQQSPEFNSGNARKDLVDLLTYLANNNRSEKLAKIWPRIMSYATGNAAFGKVLREKLFEPRRRGLTAMLTRAAESGEITAGIDPDFAADLLIGPIMHRRFTNNNKVGKDLAERVVAAFYRAFAARA